MRDYDESLQSDTSVRVVTVQNLTALCSRASGMCHRFEVVSTSDHRVVVEYSNPDEWGWTHPIRATFPAYIDSGFGRSTFYVVLGAMLKCTHGGHDGEEWQCFHPITDGPELWRDNSDSDVWRTREEIAARMIDATTSV